MSRREALLSNVVQIARPLTMRQERIVSVKLHPDAVSVLQLRPVLDRWQMERLVSWSLSAPIGRAAVQDNYPLLVNEISAAAHQARIDGVDAGISIPASYFDTRFLTLPFFTQEDLEQESQDDAFWEEFDPELTNLEGKVVRFQILYTSENEDRSLVLVSTIPMTEINRFRGLLLDANLLPVFIENELFSTLNGIYTRLSDEDIYKPFTMLHLCPNNNMLVGHTRGRIVFKKIEISDFDEALLLELERVDDLSGEFWQEIAIRLSEQIKQAISYLVEENEFLRPEKIFLVSEYKAIDNVESLLNDWIDTIRLVPYNAMKDVDVPRAHVKYVDYFNNPSVFTSSIGLATQGLNVEGKDDAHLPRRLVSMNFLDDAKHIRNNRRLTAVNRVLSLAVVIVIFIVSGFMGINTVPAYLQTRESSKRYDNLKSLAVVQSVRRTANEKKLSEIGALNKKIQSMTVMSGYSTFLVELPALIPAEAELETLSISGEGYAEMTGWATSNQAIADIKSNLKARNFFRREPTVASEREGEAWRFTLIADLSRVE